MINLTINDFTLEGIELAIFDKDGTLIDVHTYWANMVRFRAEMIAERLGLSEEDKIGIMDAMGVVYDQMRIKPEGPVGIKKREIILQVGVDYLMSKNLPDHTDLLFDVFKTVDTQSINRLDELVKPINGLYTLIRKLKSANCKIAIATTDRTDRAALAMDKLDLLDDMDIIIGADKISKPKPHPEIIEKICSALDVSIDKSIMVGDATVDVNAGLNAGCMASIGVESGLTPPDQLRALTPYVVEDISKMEVK